MATKKKKSGPKKPAHTPRHRLPGMTYADELAQQRMVKEAVQKAAKDDMVRVMSDIKIQRTLWRCIVAMNEAFELGPKRLQAFFEAFDKVNTEWEELEETGGVEYADEKLRQRAEQVAGQEINYVWEPQMQEAKAHNEAKGVFFGKLFEEDEIYEQV